jgi:predicted dehydrogenase
MTKRIGVLGLSHDHVWTNLSDAAQHPGATIVAAADPNQPLLGRVETEFHARPYSNYDTLLDNEQLDAVFIFADNAAGVELTESAAARGLDVLIEKPPAANQAGAERMLESVRKAGTRLMVNWPFAWWPQMQHAIHLAQSGAIGDIWQVRYRAAHAGPRELGCSEFFCDWLFDPKRNGAGGVYIDYCCYGALLARVLLGMPNQVTAVGGRFVKSEIAVDDNAVLIMRYPTGLAVSEGSWTQIGSLSAYQTMIYGTTGTLMLEPREGGRLYQATEDSPEGQPVDVPAAPDSMRSATSHFLACVDSGEPFWALCHEQHGCDTQSILEAGVQSIAENRTVEMSG